VARQAAAAGHAVVGTATTADAGWVPVDVSDRAAVHALMSAVRPKLVVNTVWGDWRVSADGAANVAAEAARAGARLVHVSTDAVFAPRRTSKRTRPRRSRSTAPERRRPRPRSPRSTRPR
jgi:dTDP-4-dehydrorhamnose reductase